MREGGHGTWVQEPLKIKGSPGAQHGRRRHGSPRERVRVWESDGEVGVWGCEGSVGEWLLRVFALPGFIIPVSFG